MVRFESVNDIIINDNNNGNYDGGGQEVIDLTRAARSFNDRIVGRASSLSVLDVPSWETNDDEEAPPPPPGYSSSSSSSATTTVIQQGNGSCGSRKSVIIVTATACCLALVASAAGGVVGWQMQSTRNNSSSNSNDGNQEDAEEEKGVSSFNQQQEMINVNSSATTTTAAVVENEKDDDSVLLFSIGGNAAAAGTVGATATTANTTLNNDNLNNKPRPSTIRPTPSSIATAAATANNNNEISTTTYGNGYTNGVIGTTSSIPNPNNGTSTTIAAEADGDDEGQDDGEVGGVVMTTVVPTSSTFPSITPTLLIVTSSPTVSPTTTSTTSTSSAIDVNTPPVEVVNENNVIIDNDTTSPTTPNNIYPTYSPTISYYPTPYPTNVVTLSPTPYDYQYDVIATSLIKLYWEESYMWTMGQPPNTVNVIDDPRYCMVCLNNCRTGDTILLEECDTNDNDQYFTFIGRTIRPRDDTTLCLTVISYDPSKDTNGWPIPTPIKLSDCTVGNVKQQFIGISDDDDTATRFEIMTIEKPMSVDWCLGNAHYPKPGELIHPKWCTKGRDDTTAYWETY